MSCGASSAAQHLMLAFAPTAPYLRILCNSECFVKGGLTSLMLATVRGTDQETTIRRPSQNAAACLCGGTIALVSSEWGQMTASTNQVQASRRLLDSVWIEMANTVLAALYPRLQ